LISSRQPEAPRLVVTHSGAAQQGCIPSQEFLRGEWNHQHVIGAALESAQLASHIQRVRQCDQRDTCANRLETADYSTCIRSQSAPSSDADFGQAPLCISTTPACHA
jgi:hypothetical protein